MAAVASRFTGAHLTIDLSQRLSALGFAVESFRDAVDPVKHRRTRIAVLRNH